MVVKGEMAVVRMYGSTSPRNVDEDVTVNARMRY